MFERFLNNKKSEDKTKEMEDLSNSWDEEKILIELQPQINSADAQAIGAEALSRYLEEDNSVLSPLMYVPLLESASVVSQLDLVVVRKVAQMMARWKVTGHKSVPISINLSRIDFSEAGFMDKVHAAFIEHGINPNMITFEIHESSLMDSFEMMCSRIEGVHLKGYHIAIDDFGSNGHFLMLPFDLPVDTLKFDIAYLKKAARTDKGLLMIKGMVEGFNRAGLELICEGVETEEERGMVTDMGITHIQGFVYDRPLSVTDFENKYL